MESENFSKRMMENLPEFENAKDLLVGLVEKGTEKRGLPWTEELASRIELEINDIFDHNWTNLFLMEWELTSWCRENNIAYGPGRGAAPGSLVAYLLEITDVNPLEYGLLYERFVNPERITYPDFDIDYEYKHLEKIVNHLREKYGTENVARLIKYKNTDKKENKKGPDWEFHACGYVITKEPVRNYVPVSTDEKTGALYCDCPFDQIESFGLYKNDILGLKALTRIKNKAAKTQKRNKDFDYKKIPLEDKKTLEAFARGKTRNVFQFESRGMKKILKEFHPESFRDLVLLNAIYRPGLLDYIPEVIAAKKKGFDLRIFKNYADILNETYGVPVYQEQIIQLVSRISGISYGEADIMRRAMGKRNPEILMEKKVQFTEAAIKKGISSEQAEEIYEVLVIFSRYAFNKSHAVAYTKMAFWDMYLSL